MSEAFTQPKYIGSALPGNAETVVLFSTVAAFSGKRLAAMAGWKRFLVDVKHDQSGTIKGYRSQNRGVSWNQFYDSGAIAAPAATASTVKDVGIEPYEDFKFEWVNGATPQGTFIVDMALTDERAPLT